MKFIIFTFLFTLFLFLQLTGNPIPPVLIINEIYFEGDDWTIELTNELTGDETLDNYWIYSSSGESWFNPGITFPINGYVVITQDSLQSPLNIDTNGDIVEIMGWDFYDECRFGDFPYSWINPTYVGQSIARMNFREYKYFLTKDNNPTLGIHNDTTGTQGTFCGYVFDNQNNPIQGAEIRFYYPYYSDYFPTVTSDVTGYFLQRMFSLNYEISILVNGSVLLETPITIEPDSTTYCEFFIDIYSVEGEQLQRSKIILRNYPNPFIESTRISFNLATKPHKTTQINIYNAKGQLIRKFQISNDKYQINEVVWDGKDENSILQPPGFYFYSLEIDGKKVKTNKMIMVR